MQIMAKGEVYQLKITLLDTNPPIWRRLHVLGETTLAKLHEALQVVMGWKNCHLYEFSSAAGKFGPDDPGALAEMGWKDDRKARVSTLLPAAGAKAQYLYDFGDGWKHEITLEEILPPAPRRVFPMCKDGAEGCPPEDCGGPHAFGDLLQVLSNPKHPQFREMQDFFFYDFLFSVRDINLELREKFPAPRRKKTTPPKARLNAMKPKVIRPGERVPLSLQDRERQLILEHTFAEDELTNRLRLMPDPGRPRNYLSTLDDLDSLAGHVAAQANHEKNKRLEKELSQLYDRIAGVLEAYIEREPAQ